MCAEFPIQKQTWYVQNIVETGGERERDKVIYLVFCSNTLMLYHFCSNLQSTIGYRALELCYILDIPARVNYQAIRDHFL